jgi:hypothetical protein
MTSACSAHRHASDQEDLFADTDDPFADPFFTQSPEWDASVLRQSEILSQDAEEPEKPQSFAERSQGIIFSTIIVGASLGRLALPLLGLGF